MFRVGLILLIFLVSTSGSFAFQQQAIFHARPAVATAKESRRLSALRVTVKETSQHHNDRVQHSYKLSEDEIKPIIRLSMGEKEKVINAQGLWCVVATILTCPIWLVAMTVLNFVNKNINDEWDPNRAIYDKTGKIWSKAWLTLANSYPTSSGEVDYLRGEGKGACLYVANHASWLDIPVLCTVLDPVFKFIAKGELTKVPCIGQQLQGGDHILIDREDRRSQLRTFKEGINWLNKGVPIMAFPEGQRSPDGRLIDFKGGVFSMAVKTGVPIVPLSVSHTHAIMPSNALFPVQSGRGKLHVHVHSPIESKGRTDAELADMVRKAFLSELPLDHLPLDMDQEELIASSAVRAIEIETASKVSQEHHEQNNGHVEGPTQVHHHDSPTNHHKRAVSAHNGHHALSHEEESALPLYAIDIRDEMVEKV